MFPFPSVTIVPTIAIGAPLNESYPRSRNAKFPFTSEAAFVMLKVKLSVAAVRCTEVAVMVGEAAAPVGTVAGGVYSAAKLGEAEAAKVPQSGEQSAPPAV